MFNPPPPWKDPPQRGSGVEGGEATAAAIPRWIIDQIVLLFQKRGLVLWALAQLSPFTPHCIERRISRYGYHSSVANSTPGTVARIGSACAPAALIYLPPFPILSLYRHTDHRYLLIFYCHNRCFRTRCPGIRLPDTGYRELRTTRPGLSRFFSWPSSWPWSPTTFVGSRSLGYRTTRTTSLSRGIRAASIIIIISLWRCIWCASKVYWIRFGLYED